MRNNSNIKLILLSVGSFGSFIYYSVLFYKCHPKVLNAIVPMSDEIEALPMIEVETNSQLL